MAPNNSFKPKPLRYGKGMAGKACHAFASTTRFGLTQALGAMSEVTVILKSASPTGVVLLFTQNGDSDLVDFPLGSEHAVWFDSIYTNDPFPQKRGTLRREIIEMSESPGEPRRAVVRTSKGRSRHKSLAAIPNELYLLIWNCWHHRKLPYALDPSVCRS